LDLFFHIFFRKLIKIGTGYDVLSLINAPERE
jgi:hypothetical protein